MKEADSGISFGACLRALKAISDETRLRILMILGEDEYCACQIIALLKLAPSTVSKHLSILREAGFIESRKDGRWMHYRIAEKSHSLFRKISDLLKSSLKGDEVLIRDQKRFSKILELDLEEVCCLIEENKCRC